MGIGFSTDGCNIQERVKKLLSAISWEKRPALKERF